MLRGMRRSRWGKWGLVTFVAGSFAIAACSSGTNNGDAGADAANDSSADSNNGNDASMCGVTLCVQNNQSPLCPSCSPSAGDNCSPPAAITCNYTNGCSGAELQSSQCTCELPDAAASDAGDASSTGTNAYWSCQLGV